MEDPFVILYQDQMSVVVLSELINAFERAGFTLECPGLNRITALDMYGAQLAVSREWIHEKLTSKQEVVFQFWLTDSIDACYAVHFKANGVVQICFLDGLNDLEKHRVMRAMMTLFRQSAHAGVALALVVDMVGEHAGIDWDMVVLEGEPYPGTSLPSILVMKDELLDTLHGDGAWSRSAILPGYSALTS